MAISVGRHLKHQLRFFGRVRARVSLLQSTRRNYSDEAPPEVPTTCCMSGCANCVWLDYAEELVKYYDKRAETVKVAELLADIEQHIQDPMIKAFIKMEIRTKYK